MEWDQVIQSSTSEVFFADDLVSGNCVALKFFITKADFEHEKKIRYENGWKPDDNRFSRKYVYRSYENYNNDTDLEFQQSSEVNCLPGYCIVQDAGVRNLQEAVENEGLCHDVNRVRPVLEDLGRCLCHVHEEGFVHSDINPQNFLRDELGRWRLTDFDAAVEDGNPLRKPMNAVYMPPELKLDGKSLGGGGVLILNAQKSIDVWAFGAVMFYLVTGKHLFEGKADIDGQWDPISCFQALASIPDSTAKDLLVDLFQENPEDRPPIGLFFSMISSVHKILLMKSAVSRTSCKKLSDTGDINSLRRDIAGITERLDMQKDGVLQINQKKVQVVFFGSDPKHRLLDRIDLGEEIRSIKMTAWAAFDRKALEFVECQATRSDDMELQLQTKNPDILHFSGLGTQSGEFLCNSDKGTPQTITKEALCALIGAEQRNLHLVFMNACYSNVQAEELSSVVDCVIGMCDRISDKAAIAFSGSFYQAIGFGKDVETAFKYGIAALRRKAPLE